MSVLLVGDIKIGGSRNYGGGIAYNLNVEVSQDTQPTRATVSIVNQTGIYDDIQLSTTNLTTIEAGNYSIKMCPISYKVSERAGQKIMTVTFEDGSVILDKIYVGILGEFKTIAGERVYKGKIQYFSDAVGGEVTYTNDCAYIKVGGSVQSLPGNVIILGSEIIDPRNPCGTSNVKYTLNQLLDTMVAKGINIQRFTSNDHYYQQYIGTCRQVLSSWCADYGYSFYWDKDVLKFIDLRTQININSTLPKTTETLSFGKTLEGSYKQIAVAAWRKGREEKSGSSNTYRLLFFRPLRLTSLLGEALGEQIEMEAVLGKYSDSLRLYYILNNDPQGLARAGFDVRQEYYNGDGFYENVKTDLQNNTVQAAKDYYPYLRDNKGKLVRANYSHALKTANYSQVLKVAEEFIGRYYICNQSLTNKVDTLYFTQTSTIRTGAGQPRFVDANCSMESLGEVFSEIVGLGAANESIFQGALDTSNPAAASWMFERQGVWNPGSTSSIVKAIDQIMEQNQLVPKKLDTSLLSPATLTGSGFTSQDELWYVPFADDQITIEFQYENNFAETDTVSRNSAAFVEPAGNYNTCEGCIQLHEKNLRKASGAQFQSRYGLMHNGNAPTISVVGLGLNLQLQGPSQADYQAIETIVKTRKIVIPKIEDVRISGDLLDGDYMEARVLQKNATLDYIINVPSDFSGEITQDKILVAEKSGVVGDSDTYEYKSIDAYLDQVLSSISHGSEGPAQNREIREAGYPSMNPTPADGLTALTIEYGTDGVFTTYKFNSRPKTIPALELIATKIQAESLPSIGLRLKT